MNLGFEVVNGHPQRRTAAHRQAAEGDVHLDSGPRDPSPLCGASTGPVETDVNWVTCEECLRLIPTHFPEDEDRIMGSRRRQAVGAYDSGYAAGIEDGYEGNPHIDFSTNAANTAWREGYEAGYRVGESHRDEFGFEDIPADMDPALIFGGSKQADRGANKPPDMSADEWFDEAACPTCAGKGWTDPGAGFMLNVGRAPDCQTCDGSGLRGEAPSPGRAGSRKQAYSEQDWNEVLVTYHNLTGQHLSSNTVREQQARTILDQTGNPVQAVAAVTPQFSSMDVMMAHDRALQSMSARKQASSRTLSDGTQLEFKREEGDVLAVYTNHSHQAGMVMVYALLGEHSEAAEGYVANLPDYEYGSDGQLDGQVDRIVSILEGRTMSMHRHAYDYPDAVGDPHSLPDRVNESGAKPFENPEGYNANPLHTENPMRPEDTGLGRGETSMASLQHREARILEAMSRASHEERRVLAEQLNDLRREAAAVRQADRDVNLAGAVIRDHLTPVLPHTLHTGSTDWLDDSPLPGATPDEAAREMAAQAALWFRKTHEAVIEDHDEFTEQARGQARRVASAFGEHKDAAVDTFLREATRLRTAAGFTTTAEVLTAGETCPACQQGQLQPESQPGGISYLMCDYCWATFTADGTRTSSRKQAIFEIEEPYRGYTIEVQRREADVHLTADDEFDWVIWDGDQRVHEEFITVNSRTEAIARAKDFVDNVLNDPFSPGGSFEGLASLRKGGPFADYKDFDDCVSKNSDKDDPQAYCGRIKHETEGARKEAQAKHQNALDRLERDKTDSAVWAAMEALDEYTMTLQTREKQALAEDAHDLIADLALMSSADPEWDDLVQDRVDAARFVLRGRQGSRKQAYDDAYPIGHTLQQFRDHSGDPIVIGSTYKVLGTSIEGEAVGVDTRHTNTSMMGSDGAVVLMRPDGSAFPSRGRVGGNFNLIPTGTTASRKTAAENGWFVIDSVSGDAEGPFDSHDEAMATSMEQEIMDNIITEVRYGHEGRDGRFIDQTHTLSSRRTAEEKMTCAECGDSIAKDPDGSYHHDNGEKHDHEAKPAPGKEQGSGNGNGEKESRRVTAGTYCKTHDVWVGEENASTHEDCSKEQRKTKDSRKHADAFDDRHFTECRICGLPVDDSEAGRKLGFCPKHVEDARQMMAPASRRRQAAPYGAYAVVFTPEGDKKYIAKETPGPQNDLSLVDTPEQAYTWASLDSAEQVAYSYGFQHWGDQNRGPMGSTGGGGQWQSYGEMNYGHDYGASRKRAAVGDTCRRCNGTGYVEQMFYVDDYGDPQFGTTDCPDCGGSGIERDPPEYRMADDPIFHARKQGTGVGDEGDLSHDENADQVPATSDDSVLGDPDPQSGHGHSGEGQEGGEYRPNIDTEPFNPITWTQAAQAVQYLPEAEQPKLMAAISRHDHRTVARLVRMAEGVPEELKNSDSGAKDCTACDGKGTVPDEDGGVKDCEVCDGTGEAKSEGNGDSNGNGNGNGDKESARRRQAFRNRVQASLQRQ